ncbi:threonine/serine dehydratase [Embleya sp. NPDC050493]|uniref:threonine/serine dehydratase n=1 Tax=Embleya sp. NPDC050493 TaxID=3363989 RepID=UPI0037AE934A
MRKTRLDIDRIRAARRAIDPIFLDTPLYRCEALEPGLGCAVSIKLETANPVRSFKGRGTEVIASRLADSGERAVVCASAGNLGQALAWSGRGRGLDVTVVASRFAPAAKLDRIRALGAKLELVDGDFDMARERAAALARNDGIRLVEDSLDIETCEGAATVGLELVRATPTFDAVLIALGGGALATGVGRVVKAMAPGVEVICVQPLGAPAMTHSWRERRVVTTDSTNTIADGVAGRRPIPAVLDDLLLVADDAVLVRETSIIAGMRMLLDHAGLVVEPSAALGIAAILEDRDRFAGRHVVTIVCGSNVDVDAYHRWVGAAGAAGAAPASAAGAAPAGGS